MLFRSKYLDENIAALDVRLSASQLAELHDMFPHGAAAGDRYPASMMGALNR